MESLTPIDPQAFRWFFLNGELWVSAERTVLMSIAVHADDLPEGPAGADTIAERVRLRYADSMDAPEARWISITVTETQPSSAYQGDPLGGLS